VYVRQLTFLAGKKNVKKNDFIHVAIAATHVLLGNHESAPSTDIAANVRWIGQNHLKSLSLPLEPEEVQRKL
jgi:hypothetical protein